MRHFLLLATLLLPLGASADTPNFIIIFTDDQGYNDLGCFGSETIKTPHLDRMAKEGRKFTSFMVPCPVCTPSRAGLLTGCYPKRIGMQQHVLFPASTRGMHPDEVTIADHLKANGYATACIGKWHLGHYPECLPRAQGFDSYYGIPYSNDMNHPDNKGKSKLSRDASWVNQAEDVLTWHTPLVQNEDIIELPVDQRTITRRYTDKAIEFVTANKDKPFFLYLPHSMPHIPLFVPEDAYDPDPQNAYKCVIEHIDAEIGRLMDTVRKEGLSENTYVIFTSDNGPWLQFKNHGGSAKPLRDGKGTNFEGGQRVPCIMWAPGRIPADTTCGQLASTIDLLPTIAHLIDKPLAADRKIDGLNISALLTGDAPSPRTEFLHYTSQGTPGGIRLGDWKLLLSKGKNKEALLFNLAEDLPESNNLAAKRPDKVAELTALLTERDAEITAHSRAAWHTDKPHPWPATLGKK
ncbi:MAG: sulfatase [Verrucomicrobia bacterium]|nr:sulfatase [Verrucomicrobiota bacterium]